MGNALVGMINSPKTKGLSVTSTVEVIFLLLVSFKVASC